MKELLVDVWGLLLTLVVSAWSILEAAVSLVVIDDPFWRGVEVTVLALLVWRHRKALISWVDGVPLLGGLVARGLSLIDLGAERGLNLGAQGLEWLRVQTWDRLVGLVRRADKDLRE